MKQAFYLRKKFNNRLMDCKKGLNCIIIAVVVAFNSNSKQKW